MKFGPQKLRNSSTASTASMLQSMLNSIAHVRSHLRDKQRLRPLSEQEQSWLVDLDHQETELISQARALNLLLDEAR